MSFLLGLSGLIPRSLACFRCDLWSRSQGTAKKRRKLRPNAESNIGNATAASTKEEAARAIVRLEREREGEEQDKKNEELRSVSNTLPPLSFANLIAANEQGRCKRESAYQEHDGQFSRGIQGRGIPKRKKSNK